MSDAKPATVYAYLDLAESDVPYSYIRVPLSDGRTYQFLDHVVEVSRWMGDLDEYSTKAHHFTLVRGTRALEVAEREVREAATERYPHHAARGVKSVQCRGSRIVVEWMSAFISQCETEDNARLSRAVDLRDRLRAKPANSKLAKPKLYAKVYMSTAKPDNPKTGSAWRIDYESVAGGMRYEGGFSDDTYQQLAHGEEVPIECSDEIDWYWIAEPRVCIDYANGPEKTVYAASFSVEYARRSNVCRLCGLPPDRGSGLPFMYDFGREHAHEACLKQERMSAKPADPTPSPSVHWLIPGTVGPACWTANGLVASPPFDLNNHPEFVTCLSCKMVIEQVDISPDVKKVAEQIGREITKSLNHEVKPMPEKPKPDPHAECRLSLRDGVLVDDYGRALGGVANVEGSYRVNTGDLNWSSVKVVVNLYRPALDGATRPAPASPEPVYITMTKPLCEEAMSSAFRAANEMESKLGRKVVVVPYAGSVENPIVADISRRADIAAASKKGWRWGLAVGVLSGVILSFLAATLTARFAPDWLWRAVDRAESSRRTPTPPADEHARETEDARANGREVK